MNETSSIHPLLQILLFSKENVETLLEFLGLVIGKAIFEGIVPCLNSKAHGCWTKNRGGFTVLPPQIIHFNRGFSMIFTIHFEILGIK